MVSPCQLLSIPAPCTWCWSAKGSRFVAQLRQRLWSFCPPTLQGGARAQSCAPSLVQLSLVAHGATARLHALTLSYLGRGAVCELLCGHPPRWPRHQAASHGGKVGQAAPTPQRRPSQADRADPRGRGLRCAPWGVADRHRTAAAEGARQRSSEARLPLSRYKHSKHRASIQVICLRSGKSFKLRIGFVTVATLFIVTGRATSRLRVKPVRPVAQP